MSADEHSAAYSPTATAVRRAAPGCPGRGISVIPILQSVCRYNV